MTFLREYNSSKLRLIGLKSCLPKGGIGVLCEKELNGVLKAPTQLYPDTRREPNRNSKQVNSFPTEIFSGFTVFLLLIP